MSETLQAQAAALGVEEPVRKSHAGRGAGERFYRPELDVLRLFAFLAVFFHHLRPHAIPASFATHASARAFPYLLRIVKAAFAAGSLGVDLFFVLSAYLITELLLREKSERGALNVRAFYARRVLRIWPLYFFFIALAYFLQRFIPGNVFSGGYVAAFLLLSGNWICAFHGLPASVALPLWSVSVEEQFYLVWPQIVRKATTARMASVAVGLLVLASTLRGVLLTVHVRESMIKFNTFTRIDGIAVGILVSLWLRGEIPRLSPRLRVVLVAAGGLALLLAGDWMIHRPDTSALNWLGQLSLYLVAALASMLLLLSFLGLPMRDWWLVRRLRLVFLGKISYGLYVYHYLALFLARQLLGALRPAIYPAFVSLGLLLTITMAIVSYFLLERPFLHLKRRFTYVMSRPD